MSPKPVDVRRALETLRAESPTPETTERVRLAITVTPPLPLPNGRGRRSIARSLTAAMITTALAVVVFSPRSHAGAAWAQTLAATLDAPACHTVSHWANGRTSMEEWRSGVKRATVLYTEDGQVVTEMRNDGKKSLNYFNWFGVAKSRKEKLPANALAWAVISKDFPSGHRFYEFPLGDAKIALDDPDIKVVGHEEATETRPETYRLQQTVRLGGKVLGMPRSMIAEIDPATHRIHALIDPPRKFKGIVVTNRTEIDYPASIPASVFSAKPQAAKVDAVYDSTQISEKAQRTLRQGLGTSGPVTLRAVFLDGDGELWAYWTGAPSTRTFTTLGARLQSGGHRNAYPSGLTGLGRVPVQKVGSTVNLDIPYQGGTAHFRKAPVLRIGFINHVQGVLIAYRPTR